jgi:hypothetical protein
LRDDFLGANAGLLVLFSLWGTKAAPGETGTRGHIIFTIIGGKNREPQQVLFSFKLVSVFIFLPWNEMLLEML